MWVEKIVEGGWRVRVLRSVKGKIGGSLLQIMIAKD